MTQGDNQNPMLRRRSFYVYEFYYEYKLYDKNWLVRLWFKDRHALDNIARMNLDVSLSVESENRSVGELAEWCADTIVDVSAVHVQNQSSGIGVVIYTEWP